MKILAFVAFHLLCIRNVASLLLPQSLKTTSNSRHAARRNSRMVTQRLTVVSEANLAVAPSLVGAAQVSLNAGPETALANPLVLVIGLSIGFTLGLLGGGGSIIALPSLIYLFHEPTNSAIAESFVIVCIGSLAGFLSKAKSYINFAVLIPFVICTMGSSFLTAKAAGTVPEPIRLGLFLAFAFVSALNMWSSAAEKKSVVDDSLSTHLDPSSDQTESQPTFPPAMAAQATGIGVLTSLIGAGGGFVIVPALTLLGRMPIKEAVTSALLVICLNSATAFCGNLAADVPIHWALVVPFSAATAAGALIGSRQADKVDANTTKRLFSGMAFLLCGYVFATKAAPALASYFLAANQGPETASLVMISLVM